jgi:hypothetical protein
VNDCPYSLTPLGTDIGVIISLRRTVSPDLRDDSVSLPCQEIKM